MAQVPRRYRKTDDPSTGVDAAKTEMEFPLSPTMPMLTAKMLF
jgi:hypothetical protein